MARPLAPALLFVAAFFCVAATFDIVPSGSTEVVSGGGLYLRYVDSFPNLTQCAVSAPGVGDVVLSENRTTWPIYMGRGYYTGVCGAMMLFLNAKNAGKWTLRATFSPNGTEMVEEQELNVTVTEAPVPTGPVSMKLPAGEWTDIEAGDERSVYCLLRDPRGTTVGAGAGACQHAVSSGDEGVWTAVYAVSGSLREIEVQYAVEAVKMELVTSVQPSSTVAGGLDVLCRLPAVDTSELVFCRMVHPNGTGIHLQEGLSDGSFSYYGEGLKRDGVHDCGITIHKPKMEDFGAWKCVLAFANGVEGGYVYVTNSSLRQLVRSGEAVAERVVALRGANVTVGCRAPASLGSCWFRHPDGSVVAPTPHGQGPFTYSGEGLSLGSCIVRFVAQTADSGTWTCYMGVPDHIDGDIATTIQVDIIDEAVVTLKKEVVVEEREAVTIGCKTVVDSGLSTCRFIHPHGWGMTFSGQKDASAVKNRYRYFGNGLSHGECFLRITEVKEEDFGQWTCAGTLEQQEYVEISTRIMVIKAGGLSAGAIAAIASIGLISSAIGLAMILGYKRRRNSSKA